MRETFRSRLTRRRLPDKEQVVILAVGSLVSLWSFDTAGADRAALPLALSVLALALAAAWYARTREG